MPSRLYDYPRSSSAWRVRIGIELKGLDVERVPIDVSRAARAQDEPGYDAINPMRQVPVLEWRDGAGEVHRISQSVAILEYLDEIHPRPPLIPREPLARARVREMVQIVNAGIQPLQNNRVVAEVEALGGDGRTWAANFIARGLGALERLARARAGTYLMGDSVTLADVFLVPQMFNARLYQADLTGLDTLVRVDAALGELDAFRAAHPDRQPVP